MKKSLLIAVPAVLVVMCPLFFVVVVAGLGALTSCDQPPTAPTPTPGTGSAGGPGGGPGGVPGASDIRGGVSTPVVGQLGLAQANIPGRAGPGGLRSSLATVLGQRPDFVTLNEQGTRGLGQIAAPAPGYGAYRDNTPGAGAAGPGGAAQALDTVVLYRAGWQVLDAGRVQIVTGDHTVYAGRAVVWNRYATWTLLERPADGAIVAVVSVHQMTNPARYGPDLAIRQAQYGQGMDTLTRLVAALAAHGPVFVGGDFNVHPTQTQPWAAPVKMRGAGFDFYSQDLDYLFYARQLGVTLAGRASGPMASDHPWIAARFDMNGVTTRGAQGSAPAAAQTVAGGGGPVLPTAAHDPGPGPQGQAQLRRAADGSVRIGQWRLSADQVHNAQTMVAMATARGGTAAAVVIISAALAESGLSTNPGSLGGAYGPLQQTPSAGWGTIAQVMDVGYAADAFLDHLARVPNWRAMPPWQAAQAVQRSGAGQASNGRANYGPNLAQAQAIVAALGAGGLPGDLPGALTGGRPCAGAAGGGAVGATVPTGVEGHGSFVANTQVASVGPYDQATLMARMQQVMARNGSGGNLDPFFGTEPDGSWFHDCQHFVANLDGRSSSGYGSAQSAWNGFLANGAAHPAAGPDGMRPPVGAWLYFAPNHVVVYLGNNLVAGTDTWGTGTAKIGPVSDITNGRWHLPYLGWVAPWGTSSGTPQRARAA